MALNFTAKIVLVVALAIGSTTGAMWLLASRQMRFELERQQSDNAEQHILCLARIFTDRTPGARMDVRRDRSSNVSAPDLAGFGDASVVDDAVVIGGGNATVFSFDRAKDVFVRKVTTLLKENGSKATGTVLAADSPAQAFLRRGRTYKGPALLFGRRLFTVYQPVFDANGAVEGALYVGVPVEELQSAVSTTTEAMTITAGAVVVIGCLAAALAAARSLRPLRELSKRLAALAAGDLQSPIPHPRRGDEIGTIAESIARFRQALFDKNLSDEAAAREHIAKERRAQALTGLTMSFEAQIGTLTQALTSAAASMESTSERMSQIAELVTERSAIVSSNADSTSLNVQHAAEASERIAGAAKDIAVRAARSSKAADEASNQASRTDEIVQGLVSSADRIGEVVDLIASIATQTNLLSLNATIEAARAGDAGRGFGVVAAEVKQLASRTTTATSTISAHIEALQTETRSAVTQILEIGRTTEELRGISLEISTAMDAQRAATDEIAHNVSEAAKGTLAVSVSIVDVRNGARDTGDASTEVLAAARAVARQARDLGNELSGFLSAVRVA